VIVVSIGTGDGKGGRRGLLPAQTRVTGRVTVWNLSLRSCKDSSIGSRTCLDVGLITKKGCMMQDKPSSVTIKMIIGSNWKWRTR
jgi:hypothetical protein